MIKILADSPDDARRIAAAVDGKAKTAQGADEFTNGDGHAECLILGCRQPIPTRKIGLLREIGRKTLGVPVILVTDPDPEVARQLRDTRVSDLLWFDELIELPARIDAALRTVPLFRLADQVQESKLPAALRSALPHSLRAATDVPFCSVKDLAGAVSYSPATLSRQFRESVATRATLSQLLSALVIVRAHELRTSGLGWEAVSQRLGFVRQTLHRKSRRWPGSTLQQLQQVPRAQLMARFVADLVRPLLSACMGQG
ncbi:helix-turn-helix domain-containing protein [Candidatus Palauibacter sp.]|uniref:helix-turn-helix domain-containing protein n=1 Tax=Candidatus Palauibacter sp. TaxID=3101350 RepID=UPI003AF2F1FF